MRPLELLLLATLAARLGASLFVPHRTRWLRGLGAAAFAAALLHGLGEGPRWMLAPAYALAALYGLLALRPPRDVRAGWRWAGGLGAALPLAVSGALASVLAVPSFEAPDPVGSTLVEVDAASGPLPVRLYYPTDAEGRMPYAPEAERAAFAQKYGLPDVVTSHLAQARLDVAPDAEVAGGPWPVLLFAHGYHVPPSFYGGLLPALAGRGYVVAAVAFPGEATVAVFPDGRAVPFDQAAADAAYGGDLWEQIGALNAAYDAAGTEAERLAVFRQIDALYPDARMYRRWAADLSAVLDALPTLDPVAGHLDLDRVGALGHSAGGGAAAEACLHDDRLGACANWDGAQWGSMASDTLRTPLLALTATPPPDAFRPNAVVYRAAQAGSEAPFLALELEASGHASFSDIPALVRLGAVNEGGTIDPADAHAAVVDVTDAFFKTHLGVEGAPDPEAVAARHPFAAVEG